MRVACLTIAVAATLLLTAAPVPAAGTIIAFVDMDALFEGYYKKARSDSAIRKQEQLYREREEELVTEIEAVKKKRDECQANALKIVLSDEARAEYREKAKELNVVYEEKINDYKEFRKRTVANFKQQLNKMRNDLVQELEEFLANYCERENIDLLLDRSGRTLNNIPVIIYYRKSQDITETVLAELNRGHEHELKQAEAEGGEGDKLLELKKTDEGTAEDDANDDEPETDDTKPED